MTVGPLTSVVFPAYNPGAILERTWREVERFLAEASGNWEVVFVCDGCTDGSDRRLTRWAATSPARIRVVSYVHNRGKGHAVRLGLEAARGDWRVFADVDLAYSFADIQRVAQSLWDGADVVIASRTHPESQMILPTRLQGYAYRRHLQSLVFSQLVRLMLPLRQRDTQAGLKGMNARAAELIVPRLSCNGFGFDCELLTACARLGLRVQEIPVCVRYEDCSSTTSVQTMSRMVKDLWHIRRVWRNVPPAEFAPVVGPHKRRAA